MTTMMSRDTFIWATLCVSDVPISLRHWRRGTGRVLDSRNFLIPLHCFTIKRVVDCVVVRVQLSHTHKHTQSHTCTRAYGCLCKCTLQIHMESAFPDGLSQRYKNINQDANIYIVIYLNYFITLLSVIISSFVFFRLFVRFQSDKVVWLPLPLQQQEVSLRGDTCVKMELERKVERKNEGG